jgi:hypothetical protein
MKTILSFLVVCSFLVTAPIHAGHPGKGNSKHQNDPGKSDDKKDDGKKTKNASKDKDERDFGISKEERKILDDYIVEWRKDNETHGKGNKDDKWGKKDKHRSLPPGLAKKVARGGDLPPGWQKKVARGEVLPDDIFKRASRLPEEILKRLPRQPDGTVLMAIDGKLFRLRESTKEILDVFDLE